MKIRIALLLCLVSVAVLSVCGAYKSLHRMQTYVLPEDVSARFSGMEENAEFFLREADGYVAVFAGKRAHTPLSVTDIEMSGLRTADKALVRRGIPVSGAAELLMLLEDLGS